MRISDWSSDVCSSDLPIIASTTITAIAGPAARCIDLRNLWRCVIPALESELIRGVKASSAGFPQLRSEEHTSELQSLMRISYAVFCLKKKKNITRHDHNTATTI